MNEQELIEQLAEREHASWVHWMEYLFSKCEMLPDGSAVIPGEYVRHWQRQVVVPYRLFSEKKKQSDPDQGAPILPIIGEHIKQAVIEINHAQIKPSCAHMLPHTIL